MIPFDKFGRPIYGKLYARLFAIGMKLKRLGYKESVRFPNLFVKSLPGIVFFADLRGTEFAPIWENPGVFFYFQGDRLKNKKVIIDEWISLNEKGCDPRTPLSEEDGEGYLLDQCNYALTRDYCSECSKEFFVYEGYRYAQCSVECQEKATERLLREKERLVRKKWEETKSLAEEIVCAVCGRHPEVRSSYEFGSSVVLESFDKHHVSYETDQTVLVCKQCHGKITKRQKGLEYFFPVDSYDRSSGKVLSFVNKKKDVSYLNKKRDRSSSRKLSPKALKALKVLQILIAEHRRIRELTPECLEALKAMRDRRIKEEG